MWRLRDLYWLALDISLSRLSSDLDTWLEESPGYPLPPGEPILEPGLDDALLSALCWPQPPGLHRLLADTHGSAGARGGHKLIDLNILTLFLLSGRIFLKLDVLEFGPEVFISFILVTQFLSNFFSCLVIYFCFFHPLF